MSFPQQLRDFVDRETWTYAKTMPEWPHEYIVRAELEPIAEILAGYQSGAHI